MADKRFSVPKVAQYGNTRPMLNAKIKMSILFVQIATQLDSVLPDSSTVWTQKIFHWTLSMNLSVHVTFSLHKIMCVEKLVFTYKDFV